METALTDSVGNYLKEIGRIPMLTPEQEIVLGRKVQKFNSLLSTKENLILRYGLNSQPQTFKEIGSQIGLSREGVRLQEKKALSKLRET